MSSFQLTSDVPRVSYVPALVPLTIYSLGDIFALSSNSVFYRKRRDYSKSNNGKFFTAFLEFLENSEKLAMSIKIIR